MSHEARILDLQKKALRAEQDRQDEAQSLADRTAKERTENDRIVSEARAKLGVARRRLEAAQADLADAVEHGNAKDVSELRKVIRQHENVIAGCLQQIQRRAP